MLSDKEQTKREDHGDARGPMENAVWLASGVVQLVLVLTCS